MKDQSENNETFAEMLLAEAARFRAEHAELNDSNHTVIDQLEHVVEVAKLIAAGGLPSIPMTLLACGLALRVCGMSGLALALSNIATAFQQEAMRSLAMLDQETLDGSTQAQEGETQVGP